MTHGPANRGPHIVNRRETTRILDTAVGVLVGWRRCSTRAAFEELISASERHGIGVFAMASGLVALATRGAETPAAAVAAQLAAEREWGVIQLL
ncbi:ANTAR domain-containing protein [Mycobacterium scrofulaceum]|uniref:ANTAR domain-containing protein n=1 Tax=Mycobacterium scrofulaceum TaxID=1783 RepID=A0A1A2VJA4_MYCSC|nr:ANTAR domain-containing protein [Mycobacterium scrofulaceum]OBI00688.1 hypothetical protein A5679_01435 [Mycobacterium scrofulaceum]